MQVFRVSSNKTVPAPEPEAVLIHMNMPIHPPTAPLLLIQEVVYAEQALSTALALSTGLLTLQRREHPAAAGVLS